MELQPSPVISVAVVVAPGVAAAAAALVVGCVVPASVASVASVAAVAAVAAVASAPRRFAVPPPGAGPRVSPAGALVRSVPPAWRSTRTTLIHL